MSKSHIRAPARKSLHNPEKAITNEFIDLRIAEHPNLSKPCPASACLLVVNPKPSCERVIIRAAKSL